MEKVKWNFDQFSQFQKICSEWAATNPPILEELAENVIDKFKNGNKIHIKKKNKGSFTRYCGGNVTSECIARGKNSPDPAIRKKATFAANARRWSH